MNTQTLILAILNFDDATGYEIKKQSSDGPFSYFVDISFGSIYPSLSKLESLGFVTSRTEVQAGKPDKKIYSITDEGRREFLDTLKHPPLPDKFKSEFLLIAMCAELTNKSVIAEAIDKQLAEMNAEIELFEEKSRDCNEDNACQNSGTQWILEYGHHVKTSAIEFLSTNRERLIGLAQDDPAYEEAAE